MEIEQNETWGSEGACVWCGDFDTHPHMVAQVEISCLVALRSPREH